MMPDLMNCPYCGGRARPVKTSGYSVECVNTTCPIQPSTAIHDTPEQAAEIWNRMVVVVKERRNRHEP